MGIDREAAAGPKVEEAGAEFALADLTDRAALRDAMGAGIDAAVHTAALVGDWMTMEDATAVNVGGTANLLDAAEAAGARRVVHLSSVVVYGFEARGEPREDVPLRTVGVPYIDTKSASDRLARRHGAIVVRPGDVYGPGSIPWTKRAFQMVTAPGASLPPARGRFLPVFVDDLVAAVVAALERGKPGTAYAVWSGEEITFREYFEAHARMAGKSGLGRVPTPVATAAGGLMEAVARVSGRPPYLTRFGAAYVERPVTPSTRRAREELGWEPRVSIDEGLRRSEEWLRAEGLLEGV